MGQGDLKIGDRSPIYFEFGACPRFCQVLRFVCELGESVSISREWEESWGIPRTGDAFSRELWSTGLDEAGFRQDPAGDEATEWAKGSGMPPKERTAVDILKVLDKSNCKKCGCPTCLAFAALVVQGRKKLRECPHLSEEAIEALGGDVVKKEEPVEDRRDELFDRLKAEIPQVDFEEAAQRIGAFVNDGRLAIPCLGKVFELDRKGNLYSECHVNAWVHLPLLNYTVSSAGRELTGQWLPFGELEQAKDWARFFSWRCERGMKQIIDEDPDFFFDAMSLFSPSPVGQKTGKAFSTSDHAIVVYPMPKVPLMIAYWCADQEFESKLTLFFDRSAEVNLGAESIYLLTMGIVEMFTRIFSTHGLDRE